MIRDPPRKGEREDMVYNYRYNITHTYRAGQRGLLSRVPHLLSSFGGYDMLFLSLF